MATNGSATLWPSSGVLDGDGTYDLTITIPSASLARLFPPPGLGTRRCPPVCQGGQLQFSLTLSDGVLTTNTGNVQPSFHAVNTKGTGWTN